MIGAGSALLADGLHGVTERPRLATDGHLQRLQRRRSRKLWLVRYGRRRLSRKAAKNATVVDPMKELSTRYPRCGYRRIRFPF
jgi:hypothetical protein